MTSERVGQATFLNSDRTSEGSDGIQLSPPAEASLQVACVATGVPSSPSSPRFLKLSFVHDLETYFPCLFVYFLLYFTF